MKSKLLLSLLFILIFILCGGDSSSDNDSSLKEMEEVVKPKTEETLQDNLSLNSGLWELPGVEWIEFDFNTEYILCDDADGYCAGWEESASKECKDNYIFKRDLTQEEQENNWKYEGCIYQMVFN